MVVSLLVERTLKAAEGYFLSSVVAALHLLTQTGSTSEIIDECRDLLNKGKETIFTATARAAPYLSSMYCREEGVAALGQAAEPGTRRPPAGGVPPFTQWDRSCLCASWEVPNCRRRRRLDAAEIGEQALTGCTSLL